MQISWYLNRLSKMPLAEIPWRIRDMIRQNLDRVLPPSPPERSTSFAPALFNLSENFQVQRFQRKFPELLKYHEITADKCLAHKFEAFGIPVIFGKNIHWHRDPLTGKQWPRRFRGDISYRDQRFGGVKFVWEFNRLYFLVSLGITHRVTDKKIYADTLLRIVNSWLADNPYPIGVHWTSPIEAGIRLANLSWALSFLKDYPFTTDHYKDINTFVWLHANHLHTYPSRFSSANNHLLAEAFGLFMAGLYFPHFKDSPHWRKQGKTFLENEVSRQILPDGGSFEYSTTYLGFAVDFFLLFSHACRQNKIPYSPAVDQRIKAACAFISSIMDQNGNIPNIGDQDSAVLVGFGLSNLENLSSILNTGACLYNGTGVQSNTSPDFKTFLLLPCTASEAKNRTECAPPQRGEKQTPAPQQSKKTKNNKLRPPVGIIKHRHSGLSIIRDMCHDKEILFTGNAMPLGMPPLYAHGHLDALSFTLSINGIPFFVDPGTYLYHGAQKWRTYFRSTGAHNTLRIDKTDFSRQPGDFMFSRPYEITRHTLEQINGQTIWQAGHNAYAQRGAHAEITRKIIWDPDAMNFSIIDSAPALRRRAVEIFFHCHPDCSVKKLQKKIKIKKGNERIYLTGDPSLHCRVLYGSTAPLAGWYSPEFNVIRSSATICFFNNASMQNCFRSRIDLAL